LPSRRLSDNINNGEDEDVTLRLRATNATHTASLVVVRECPQVGLLPAKAELLSLLLSLLLLLLLLLVVVF
jgi:hypothetical protein